MTHPSGWKQERPGRTFYRGVDEPPVPATVRLSSLGEFTLPRRPPNRKRTMDVRRRLLVTSAKKWFRVAFGTARFLGATPWMGCTRRRQTAAQGRPGASGL